MEKRNINFNHQPEAKELIGDDNINSESEIDDIPSDVMESTMKAIRKDKLKNWSIIKL